MGMPDPIVFLNGHYLPISEAKISVMDRGFLFGDGVYEVIPVYGGKPLRLEEHLRRLDHSLEAIRMPPLWLIQSGLKCVQDSLTGPKTSPSIFRLPAGPHRSETMPSRKGFHKRFLPCAHPSPLFLLAESKR